MIGSRNEHGFSIIELVIVISVVGILAAVAMARMLQNNAFNSVIIRDQLISSVRVAQQMAIGRSNVVLTLEPQGDDAVYTIEAEIAGSLEIVQSATAALESVSLQADVNELDSCDITSAGHSVTPTDSLVIEFDSLGNLVRGGVENSPFYPEDVVSGMRVCVNNDSQMSVCISASGFAYAGNCDD